MSVLEGLDVFVAICEAGSIAAAGRDLGVPRATLSRQLSRLEEELGVRLLHRSTRRLVTTQAGSELLTRARHVVAEAHAAREAVRRLDDVPRGTLRVSVPPDIGQPLAAVALSFLGRFPEVQLEVVGSAQHVDLVADGFDVAIRGGKVVDPSVIARRLLQSRMSIYASPAYLAAHGEPQTPEDLANHSCIVGFAQGREPETSWPLLDGGRVAVQGRLVTNTLALRVEAARAGYGLALVPDLTLATHAGDLRPVLADRVGASGEISVVYAERSFMLPRVRAFVDHVVDHLPREIAVAPPLSRTSPGVSPGLGALEPARP